MADPYGKLQKQIASLGPGTEFLESLYNDMISSGELDPNTTYEEFVAMDPLNTFDIDREQRAGGGMMDINTMTAPLGYALGGPAGKVGRPTLAPELYEGYDPILGDWMKDRKMRQAQPPAGAVDMTGQHVAPPEKPRWEKLRKLGKKGKDLFTGIFGAKPAGAEEGNLMDSIINLFMMNELTKEGIEWDDDDDLLAKYYDKFGDPFENIKIKNPGLE